MIAFSFNGDQLVSAATLGFCIGLGWHVAAWAVALVTGALARRKP